ncbi:PspA/IM30 family protein [Chryseomicrobium aureum]|uniref:PspA/IM30 family protein n=1 Tax=Chryseomicrobium aureum TaxID=1441723 RepID=UPI00195BB631|nr:PspA/IM30 family protein [Chryseomicrobium aureum]MBM7706293.1 phage shock protein A [Chryseomicrobium aureum]
MTNIFTRLAETFEHDVRQLFDRPKTEQERRDNPIQALNVYVREAEKRTEQTKRWVDRQAHLKAKLEEEQKQAQDLLTKRQEQYELALLTNEQDLIDFAKMEVDTYENRIHVLTSSIQRATDELIILERKHEEMKHKVKNMKVRQLQLMSTENVAKAHRDMDQVIEESLHARPLASHEEMERYFESPKAQEPAEETTPASTLEERLENLSKKQETNEQSRVE